MVPQNLPNIYNLLGKRPNFDQFIMNKSVRKSNENSNIFNLRHSTPGMYSCRSHPEKTATHQLISSDCQDRLFYCEKCSIMLASQGFNVSRVHMPRTGSYPEFGHYPKENIQTNNRTKEITSFLTKLEAHLQTLLARDNIVADFLVRSEDEFGGLIEMVNSFYHEIQEVLELQKYISYNTILNKRVAREADARELRAGLQEYIRETMGMIEDIQGNLDAVENVEYSVYSTIMKGYDTKLDSMRDAIQEDIRLHSPKLELNLPEIPKSLHTLADKLTFAGKSRKSSLQTSLITPLHLKPQQIVTEQHSIQSESSPHHSDNRPSLSSSHEYSRHKQNRRGEEYAFSFESDKYALKDMNESGLQLPEISQENENFVVIKTGRYGEMSNIEEKIHCNEALDSRESLKDYLNFEESHADHNEAETLLIS